jgi:hypothetical protein
MEGMLRRFGLAAVLLVPAVAAALDYTTPYGRLSANGFVEGGAVLRADPNSPRQRPDALIDLKLTADPHPNVRFFLETRTLFGGPPEDARGLGVFDLSDTFQNISPSVEFAEGYVDVNLPRVDVRAGIQKFAWGRLDGFQPNDVINPRIYWDPFLTDEQYSKVGVPALRADYYPPGSRWIPPGTSIELAWIPVPFPILFPLENQRWFPPAVNATGLLTIPKGSLGNGFGGMPAPVPTADTTITFGPLRTENRSPPQQLDEGAAGVRVAGIIRGVDWALSYYDGVETSPNFSVVATASCTTFQRNGECANLTRLNAVTTLTPRFDRMRLIGADGAFQVAGLSARIEAAYGIDRRFPRPGDSLVPTVSELRQNLGPGLDKLIRTLAAGGSVDTPLSDLFVSRDAVQWGVGVDYLWHGWMPILQLNQTAVLNNNVKLLLPDVDTRITFVLRKGFFGDTLATEASIVQGLERSYTSGLVQATYAITDNLRLRVGYLLIAGSRNTIIGEYKDNDEAFFQLRYSY